MNRPQMEQLLASIAASKVLVVGDLILDKYIWGKTCRISPEAPVQVVEVERDELRLGGAGNVVNNLLSLGCQVSVASVVGADEDGQKLLNLMAQRGIALDAFSGLSSGHQSQKSGAGQSSADVTDRS